MNALIEGWEHRAVVAEAVHARPHHRLADVRLRAPVPRPGKLVCAQLSFREGVPDAVVSPTFFLKSPDSVIGPDDVVELSAVDAAVFHHEAELAVVIGSRAKAVSASEAMRHVFGYTCFLDCSARGVGPGTSFQDKSYDTFGPMGPWITTADEIRDPHALHVRLWVDGALRHDYPMSDLAAPVAMMIAAASSISTLEPGDVLALGVNHQGLGPIQDGETLRMAIEQVGEFKVQWPIRSSAAGSRGRSRCGNMGTQPRREGTRARRTAMGAAPRSLIGSRTAMEVVDYLDRGADIAAEADCFVMGDRRWSYAESRQQSRSIAAALLRDGISPGAKAAVLSPNRPEAFLCVMGLLRAHLVWLPINPKYSSKTSSNCSSGSSAKRCSCTRSSKRRSRRCGLG